MPQSKTVLVIGGSGFIGTHVARRLREEFKVYATYRTRPIKVAGVTFLPMAIENRAWVKRLIHFTEPQVIVYCAGTSDPHWSAANADQADNVYSSGVGAMAEACSLLQSKIIYLSTPFVFDGRRGNYHENDTALPAYAMGKYKLGGESQIRSKSLNWVSLRSSPVIGRGNPEHPTFLDRLRMKLDRGMSVELSTREIHSYAFASGLADVVCALAQGATKNKIIHYGGLTKLSPYEFGIEFAKAFGYSENLIIESKATETHESVKDSLRDSGREFDDYSVNSTQAIELLKVKPLLLKESFDLLKKDLVTRLRSL